MGIIIDVGFDSKRFSESANKIKDKTKEIEDQLGRIAKISGTVFAGFGAGVALAVKKAGDFEQLGVSFEVLTGSAEEAQKAIDELSKFSAKTPFEFEQVAEAGKQLLGFGFEADEVREKLRAIGDVSAALGKPLGDLTLIFGQVRAAGKLTGERLLQLQERSVEILPALAKELGVAETAVTDLVSKGVVDFATFERAFQSLSEEGGVAFGGLEKQSQTLNGQISTLVGSFDLLVAEIGKEFLPIVKLATSSLIALIDAAAENKELIRLTAVVLGLGTAIAGTITAATLAAIAYIKLNNTIKIASAGANAATFRFFGLAKGMTFAGKAARIFQRSMKLAVSALGIGVIILFTDKILRLRDEFGSFSKALLVFGREMKAGFLFFIDAIISAIRRLLIGFSKIPGVSSLVEGAIKTLGDLSDGIQKDIKDTNDQIQNLRVRAVEASRAIEKAEQEREKKRKKRNKDREEDNKKQIDQAEKLRQRLANLGSGDFGKIIQELVISPKLSPEGFGALGSSIVQAISQGAEGAKKLVAGAIGAGAALAAGPIGQVIGSALEFLAQGATKVRETVQAFIGEIPETLIAITQGAGALISETIAQLGPLLASLVETIPVVVQSILESLDEFLVRLVSAVPKIITVLTTKAPEIIERLSEEAPAIVEAIIEKVPSLIGAIVVGIQKLVGPAFVTQMTLAATRFALRLTASIPFLVIRFIQEFIRNIPTIAEETGKAIADEFRKALDAINPLKGRGRGTTGQRAVKGIATLGLSEILGFQDGGIASLGRGPDSVPAFLSPGELVVPPRSFDEVVNAVADARNAAREPEAESGMARIEIGFDGPEASQVLTIRQIEDNALGISREDAEEIV